MAHKPEQVETPPAGTGQRRKPFSDALIPSLAATVMIVVIIAGSLYLHRLYPGMRTGGLFDELTSWAIVLLGAGCALGVYLMTSRLRDWLRRQRAERPRSGR